MRLSDIMSQSGFAIYAEIGLILFFVVFVAVVVRIFWPSRKAEMDRASRLPLDDDMARGDELIHKRNGGEA